MADIMGIALGPVHHIGIVVRDLEDALTLYHGQLGLPVESRHDLKAHGVRAAFLGAAGARVELLQPTRDDTGVARFLLTRGPGLHHVCFEVTDIAATLREVAADGMELIDTAPRPGAHGLVAFIHPRSGQGTLIELIQV